LIELNREVLSSRLIKKRLGSTAVWAIRLGEHSYAHQHLPSQLDKERYIPTPFSSMIFCALTFAADIFAALIGVPEKNLRRNEMLGNCFDFAL
jgi:hypothetical protein